jgi:hypothetical protein
MADEKTTRLTQHILMLQRHLKWRFQIFGIYGVQRLNQVFQTSLYICKMDFALNLNNIYFNYISIHKMPSRCRSNCANYKSISNCNSADKCSYTNGAVRKYCRLSSKYKMNKPDCNITRKFLKREKGPAEKIRRFLERKHASRKRAKKSSKTADVDARDILPTPPLDLVLRKEPTEEEIQKLTNKSHTRKIERFMLKLNPGKIRENRAKYLNGICSDSGVCLAFGSHAKKIKKHFGGFVKFDNVKYLKKIGAVSVNGFVKELEYEHDGYKAHAVLKSSTSREGDNLYYEYLVGIYANSMSKFLPNFVETYGLFNYNSNGDYEEMKKPTATKDALSGLSVIHTPPELKLVVAKTKNIEEQKTKLLQLACTESRYMSILIQHIKDAQTLLDKCQSVSFVKYDLPFVLFQVYWALYLMNSSFTHYDLHTENVLVYEPVKNAYIHYFYHLKDGSVVAFKSKYIAKLIDYGRCYYNFGAPDDKNDTYKIYENSNEVYKALCKEPKCDPKCGKNVGFEPLKSIFFKQFGIESHKSNISHDLRLLNMLIKAAGDFGGTEYIRMSNNVKLNKLISDLCKKVVYKDKYGTSENVLSGYPAKINNVLDAMWGLKDVVQHPTSIKDNNMDYIGLKKLGEMHIHEDRPLEFIPAV